MSTASLDSNRRAASVQIIALVLIFAMLVPILYALSVGPVFYLATQAELDDESIAGMALVCIYSPLSWLCENNEAAKRFFDWYLLLWEF